MIIFWSPINLNWISWNWYVQFCYEMFIAIFCLWVLWKLKMGTCKIHHLWDVLVLPDFLSLLPLLTPECLWYVNVILNYDCIDFRENNGTIFLMIEELEWESQSYIYFLLQIFDFYSSNLEELSWENVKKSDYKLLFWHRQNFMLLAFLNQCYGKCWILVYDLSDFICI